jgi:hypothetical protein
MSPSLDWLGAPRISSLEFSPPRPWLRQWHEQRRPRLSRHWRNSKRVSPDGGSNNSPHPVRKGHSFGEPGDLDHHAAHVHSFFFQYRSRRWNRRLACRYGRPLKQRTVDRNIIFGHARGGKPLLEASPNRASIERNHSGEHPHRLVHSVTSPHFARFSCGMYVNFRQCAGVGSKIREFGVEGCRSHSSSSAHHTFSLWQETAKLLLYIDHRIPALQQAVVLPMSRYDIADVGVTQRERVMSAHVTNGKCHRPR